MNYLKITLGCVVFVLVNVLVASEDISPGYKIIKRIFDQCGKSENMVKCLKIQALKFTDRALRTDSVNLVDGVSFVRSKTDNARTMNIIPLQEKRLNELQGKEIDGLLIDRVGLLFDNHKIQVSVPRLLEEGRGKMKKYIGPMLAALALKGSMMMMAFKGIALLAGKALLVGKIALVLSAIIGLKKLVSSGGGEKTTYEIIKHPHVSNSHSYSSSHYGGDYDSGDGGHYRSFDKDMMMQERIYNAYVPKTK